MVKKKSGSVLYRLGQKAQDSYPELNLTNAIEFVQNPQNNFFPESHIEKVCANEISLFCDEKLDSSMVLKNDCLTIPYIYGVN